MPTPATITIQRRADFSSSHYFWVNEWSYDENVRAFGATANRFGHGHNYELILKVTGEIDPRTGYVVDTKILSNLVNEHVISKFDHRNLNLDVPEFSNLNPTAENIAIVIFNILRPLLSEQLDLQIRLYETPRNFVEYPTS